MTQSFGSMMGTSSEDSIFYLDSLFVHAVSKKICFFFFIKRWRSTKVEEFFFSCKQSLDTSLPSANGFTFLTSSHLMLKSMFLFLNFQT